MWADSEKNFIKIFSLERQIWVDPGNEFKILNTKPRWSANMGGVLDLFWTQLCSCTLELLSKDPNESY